MSRRLGGVLLALPLFGLSALAGFFLGVDHGVKQFHLLDSSAKASVLTYELQALRAGKTEAIIKAKEIELDGAVVGHAHYLEEGHPWMLWFHDIERDHQKYMERVASYRLQHPPVVPTLQYETSNPTKAEMDAFGKEVASATAAVIREHTK